MSKRYLIEVTGTIDPQGNPLPFTQSVVWEEELEIARESFESCKIIQEIEKSETIAKPGLEGPAMDTAYTQIEYLDEQLVDTVLEMIPDLSVKEGREIVEKDDLDFLSVSNDRIPDDFDDEPMFQTVCAWVQSEDRDTLKGVIETLKNENRPILAGMVNVDYDVRFDL